MRVIPSLILFFGLLGLATAQQGISVPPPSLDPSTLATKSDLSSALSSAQTKQAAVPSSGPGVGLCKQTIVPSDVIASGGMPGTAGTCSRILQCGTSSSYVVTQFNVGSGC